MTPSNPVRIEEFRINLICCVCVNRNGIQTKGDGVGSLIWKKVNLCSHKMFMFIFRKDLLWSSIIELV